MDPHHITCEYLSLRRTSCYCGKGKFRVEEPIWEIWKNSKSCRESRGRDGIESFRINVREQEAIETQYKSGCRLSFKTIQEF